MPAQSTCLRPTLSLTIVTVLLVSFTASAQKSRKTESGQTEISSPPLVVAQANSSAKSDLDSVASISGRITDAYGRGIRGATLIVFDFHGNPPLLTRSNTFGFYRFEGLATGEDYIVTVLHGKFLFFNNSRSFTLNGAMTDMNFQADEQ